MPESQQMTLGQMRVRMSFNPSGNMDVENIKSRAADLIDICDDWKRNTEDPEVLRLLSLAMTHFEDAAMWAVKAVTAPK